MQTFARGWLVYDLTGSSLTLGWVTFAFGLPILLLSSVGGAITDRVEKRSLLFTTQILAAAVNLAIAVLISMGRIEVWHLMASAAITGTLVAFNNPGRQSSVPLLVGRDQIMNAVSLSTGGMHLTRIATPALAGIMAGIIGVQWVFYASVSAYTVSGALLALMPPLGVTARSKASSVGKDVVDGFSYVRQKPVLMALLGLAFVPLVFGMSYNFLMPVFNVEVLNRDPSGLGFLMAAMGAGSLIGSLIAASLGNFKRKGWLLLCSLTAFGASLVLFATSGQFYVSLFLLLIVGVFNTTYSTSNLTLLQLHTDDDMRGRVMGIYLITIGLMPISVLPVGALAEVVGVQTAVGVGGAIVVLFTILTALLRPTLRKL